MGTTTNLALPYPANTDFVAQGYAQIQNLATSVDNYWGAWTAFTQATAGVGQVNITGFTLTGAYKVIGKTLWMQFSIAGTATAAGSVTVTWPTAIAALNSSFAIPIRSMNATSNTISARIEPNSKQITIWSSIAGANWAASANIGSVHTLGPVPLT